MQVLFVTKIQEMQKNCAEIKFCTEQSSYRHLHRKVYKTVVN